MSAPSSLPSGEELRDLAWDALTQTLPMALRPIAELAKVELGRSVLADAYGMRLEQTLAVLAGFTSVDAVVPVYDVLRGALPNDTHRAVVARSFAAVLTTNMDLLLEDAGARDVVHLHGDWEHHSDIRTTIEQYLEGLSDTAEAKFRDSIEGRSVLVIGYSGRDRDVIRAFGTYLPQRILWVSHTTNPDPSTHSLSEELESFLENLRAAGVTVDVEFAPTIDVLLGHPTAPSASAGPAPTRQWSVPSSAVRAFEETHLDLRVLGLSAVLLELGMSREVQQLFKRHRFTSRYRVLARKQRARMSRRLDAPVRAMLLLLIPPLNPFALTNWIGNVSEFSAAVSQAGFRRAADLLDTGIILLASRRGAGSTSAELRARARRGERAAVRGAIRAAARDFDHVVEGSERIVGLGTYVDALTWQADLFKLMGRYTDARAAMAHARVELPFTNHSQRAFALWKSAEIELLAGASEEDVLRALDEAMTLAIRSGSKRTRFWILVTAADAARSADPDLARRLLVQARILEGSVGNFGRIFWLLQHGELSAALHDRGAALSAARQVRWLARVRYPMPSAALSAVLLTAQLGGRSRGLSRILQLRRVTRARRHYARMGMGASEARAEILEASIRGTAVGDDRISYYRRHGWSREAARAEGTVPDTWHVIM